MYKTTNPVLEQHRMKSFESYKVLYFMEFSIRKLGREIMKQWMQNASTGSGALVMPLSSMRG